MAVAEGADVASLAVNKLKAMLSVRNALLGYATANKSALVARLVDLMQGHNMSELAERTPPMETPTLLLYLPYFLPRLRSFMRNLQVAAIVTTATRI